MRRRIPYASGAPGSTRCGDYGEMATTQSGRTIGTWGEGSSWIGPGGIWLNREI